METDEQVARLEALIAPRLQLLGLELVLIERVTVYGRQTLRVLIDGPNGISVEDCVKANRLLMGMPELEAEVLERFDLEVSSPGVERPLRSVSDFERFIGARAQLKTRKLVDGRRKVLGRLVAVGDGAVKLAVDGQEVSVPLVDIIKANLKPDDAELFAAKPV